MNQMKQKKKIMFVMRNMAYVGSEIVFAALLRAIDSERYDVSVFTNRNGSLVLDMIPKQVKIYYQDDLSGRVLFHQDIRHYRFYSVIKGVFFRVLLRLTRDRLQKECFAAKTHLLTEEPFDLVAAFKPADIPCALYQFRGKKRAVWFHTYEFEGQPFPMTSEYIRVLASFDKIFCVSNDIKKHLDFYSDELKPRTEVLYNLQDVELIQKKAEEAIFDMVKGETKIVTVGRHVKEKGFDMIPTVARMLKENGYRFHWYIVGGGPGYDDTVQLVAECGVEDYVSLLGLKENPYPYIKKCDIYVQTSRVEGYCTATIEAKILRKPIVTTDAPGMRDQFTSGLNGTIVETNEMGLFSGIKQLMDNPKIRDLYSSNLEKEKNDNYSELEKIYKLLE